MLGYVLRLELGWEAAGLVLVVVFGVDGGLYEVAESKAC